MGARLEGDFRGILISFEDIKGGIRAEFGDEKTLLGLRWAFFGVCCGWGGLRGAGDGDGSCLGASFSDGSCRAVFCRGGSSGCG